jgi:hypothetical protein
VFSGVGATVAVKGDDRVSDTHASQHGDIYHNGSFGFGGNADIAETADLGVSHLTRQIAQVTRLLCDYVITGTF